jgi:hypothetical protein
MQQITIVFCAYDAERSRKSWQFCRFLKKKFKTVRLVVVANSADTQAMQFGGADLRVAGSNRNREWSGYDEGMAAVQSTLAEDDGVLFINDTVCQHHLSPAIAIAYFFQIETRRGPYILGFEDKGPFSEQGEPLLDHRIHGWISTWWFYLSAPAMQKLGKLSADVENALPSSAATGTELLGRLPREMAGFLDWYLFGGGPGNGGPYTAGGKTYRRPWKGRTPLTPENFAFFRAKIASILQEYLLTARIRQWGEVVDIRKVEACAHQIHRHYADRKSGKKID